MQKERSACLCFFAFDMAHFSGSVLGSAAVNVHNPNQLNIQAGGGRQVVVTPLSSLPQAAASNR